MLDGSKRENRHPLSRGDVQESTKKPLSELQAAEAAQRRVIERIARDGLPKSNKKSLMHNSSATFATSVHTEGPRQLAAPRNAAVKKLLRRFCEDREACRHGLLGIICCVCE